MALQQLRSLLLSRAIADISHGELTRSLTPLLWPCLQSQQSQPSQGTAQSYSTEQGPSRGRRGPSDQPDGSRGAQSSDPRQRDRAGYQRGRSLRPSGPSDFQQQRPLAPTQYPQQQGPPYSRDGPPSSLVPPPPGGPPALRPPRGIKTAGSDQLSDLALENAPVKILELIGDPRTGVADDVTTDSLGSVTCDLVHHQDSNEVYWYKYEFAAEQLQQTHRDGRLSEYAKNLMYILRAKDPDRWTFAALAEKFRIRQQRVIAILALKEMEAASIERGAHMSGPLSPYHITVHMEDVHLDGEGNPILKGSAAESDIQVQQVEAVREAAASDPSAVLRTHTQLTADMKEMTDAAAAAAAAATEQGAAQADAEDAAAAAAAAASASQASVDAAHLPLPNAIPRARRVARQLQDQLAALLAPHGYDLAAARAHALGSVDTALATVKTVLAELTPATSEGGEGGEGKEGKQGEGSEADTATQKQHSPARIAVSGLHKRLTALRDGVNGLYDTLDRVLLLEGATGAGDSKAEGAGGGSGGGDGAQQPGARQRWRSLRLEEERAVVAATTSITQLLRSAATPAAASSDTAAAATAGPAVDSIESAISDLSPKALARVLQGLPGDARAAFFRQLPHKAAELNAAGVADLAALRSQPQPQHSQTSEGSTGGVRTDWLDYTGFTQEQYKDVVSALERVEDAQYAVAAAQARLEGKPAPLRPPVAASAVAARLCRLNSQYQATVYTLQQEMGLSSGAPVRRQLALMHESDPGSLDRLTYVEAAQQLEMAGQASEAKEVRRKLRQAAGQPLDEPPPPREHQIQQLDEVGFPALGSVGGDAHSWALLSAWLDAKPGGRVYHRGSGERQVARLATYPAFQGWPLTSLDQVDEGELSSLNRQLAHTQEQELVTRFKRDVTYNLGLRGLGLRTEAQRPLPPNLTSSLKRAPMVVYAISDDGVTQYPPMYVLERDGTRRPLNEKETVWQERRLRDVIPRERTVHYNINRFRRKPELQ